MGQYYKKNNATVISNDIQYYSYILNKHLIGNNVAPLFNSVDIPKTNVLFENIFENIESYFTNIDQKEGFVFNNYSKGGTLGSEVERNYFSDYNARKCDAIRAEIENWKSLNVINEYEYYHLLASLIESIDKVANTASVYGAYLKNLKKAALKPLNFELLPIIESDKAHTVTNCDANTLIKDIEGQVLYLDPPYNHRQYSTNYHLLEIIAKNDNPIIHGKTGLRDYSNQKSLYCQKNKAQEVFADLIESARFDYIFLSYNNEGIIPMDFISKILKSKGHYYIAEQKYSRFKADNNREYLTNQTIEYLHCVKCYK